MRIHYKIHVHKSVHRDITMKITNKMHYIDSFIIPSQLYMFQKMFSPIIRTAGSNLGEHYQIL